MFQGLIAAFAEHLIFASALFVAFFVIFGLLFSRGAAVPFLHGILRIVASITYSPFVFLRRCATAILGFASRGVADYDHSEQYLLNKFLLSWQAFVIVIAIAWLSVTFVRTWYAFLPPAEVRAALKSTRERLADEKQQLATAAADATRMDNEWAQQKTPAMDAYRRDRQRTVREMTSANNQIAATIRASGNRIAHMERELGARCGRERGVAERNGSVAPHDRATAICANR